jgi:acetoacetyl-CoA synthetase
VEGRAPSNLEALRNPGCLATIASHRGLQRSAQQGQRDVADISLAGKMASVWARHLGVARVGPEDNFFELGGNSLLAARVLRDVQDLTGCRLPLSVLLQAPTVARLVEVVQQQVPKPSPVLVRMREGRGAPLFLVHGLSGTVMECWGMVKAMRTQRPVWGLQAPGLAGDETPHCLVEDLATTYVAHIRALQHDGPYAICGFSYGGLVAYEMARQLAQAGQAVDPLVLLDPYVHRDMGTVRRLAERAANATLRLSRLPAGDAWTELRDRARGLRPFGAPPMALAAALGMPPAQARVHEALSRSIPQYRAQPHAGPVLFVHAREVLRGQVDPMPAWRRLVGEQLRVVELPGEHLELVGRHAGRVAALLDEGLGAVRS